MSDNTDPIERFLPINIRREIINVTQAGTKFAVPVFCPGSNNLWVFINGKKEYLDYDYEEFGNSTIVFNKTIPVGSIIEILILRI